MNLPVKPSRTQQRRVQNIRPVRRSQNDHTLRPTEAVHFHQQLVQGLLFFIMAAAQAGATLRPTASISSMKMIAGATFFA